jgi:hypothetical protein
VLTLLTHNASYVMQEAAHITGIIDGEDVAGLLNGVWSVPELEAKGATDVYQNKVMVNHHGGVVLVGDHLYGHSDDGGWKCQDFRSGKELWRHKGVGKGAVHYADGMLYCLGEKDGSVALVKAGPERWDEKGRFKLSPQSEIRAGAGKIWTHPVVIGGKLYLRDQDLIYCYDVKG